MSDCEPQWIHVGNTSHVVTVRVRPLSECLDAEPLMRARLYCGTEVWVLNRREIAHVYEGDPPTEGQRESAMRAALWLWTACNTPIKDCDDLEKCADICTLRGWEPRKGAK